VDDKIRPPAKARETMGAYQVTEDPHPSGSLDGPLPVQVGRTHWPIARRKENTNQSPPKAWLTWVLKGNNFGLWALIKGTLQKENNL
jgi:hypothetical protein